MVDEIPDMFSGLAFAPRNAEYSLAMSGMWSLNSPTTVGKVGVGAGIDDMPLEHDSMDVDAVSMVIIHACALVNVQMKSNITLRSSQGNSTVVDWGDELAGNVVDSRVEATQEVGTLREKTVGKTVGSPREG